MTGLTTLHFHCSLLKCLSNRTWSSWVTSITWAFFWKTVQQLPIRFPKCNEHFFLIQMLKMLTRNSALLYSLLTYREDFLDSIATSGSLGYNDHNIVEFKILTRTLKTSDRTKTLEFSRPKFNMLIAQIYNHQELQEPC